MPSIHNAWFLISNRVNTCLAWQYSLCFPNLPALWTAHALWQMKPRKLKPFSGCASIWNYSYIFHSWSASCQAGGFPGFPFIIWQKKETLLYLLGNLFIKVLLQSFSLLTMCSISMPSTPLFLSRAFFQLLLSQRSFPPSLLFSPSIISLFSGCCWLSSSLVIKLRHRHLQINSLICMKMAGQSGRGLMVVVVYFNLQFQGSALDHSRSDGTCFQWSQWFKKKNMQQRTTGGSEAAGTEQESWRLHNTMLDFTVLHKSP